MTKAILYIVANFIIFHCNKCYYWWRYCLCL